MYVCHSHCRESLVQTNQVRVQNIRHRSTRRVPCRRCIHCILYTVSTAAFVAAIAAVALPSIASSPLLQAATD